MSAHSGARVSSTAKANVSPAKGKTGEEIGLVPYADPTGMLVGDIKFM